MKGIFVYETVEEKCLCISKSNFEGVTCFIFNVVSQNCRLGSGCFLNAKSVALIHPAHCANGREARDI